MSEYYLVKFEPYTCFYCNLLVRTIKEDEWHEDSYPGPACESDPRNKLSPEEEAAEMRRNFRTLMSFEAALWNSYDDRDDAFDDLEFDPAFDAEF